MNGIPSKRKSILRRSGGRILFLLGMVWTLPNTLIGLLAGSVGLFAGARAYWSWRDRALVFERWPWGPNGAMTLGNVVLNRGDSMDVACNTYAHCAGLRHHPVIRLGDHERAHVYQYMLLGPMFLPLYFACGGISVRNRFERAADRYAMTGRRWCPWPIEQLIP